MEFKFNTFLPTHSNNASLEAKTAKRCSEAFPVTRNNKHLGANIFLEMIQVDVAYFHDESDRNVELLQVRDEVKVEMNHTYQ